MFLITGSPAHARTIAKIYKEAFPASISRFFKERAREELLDLLELSFQLVMHWGGQALLAKDASGRILGYCLYSVENNPKDLQKSLRAAGRLLGKIRPTEVGQLTYNQLLKVIHKRKTRPTLKKGTAIISIAVAPAYQGRGVGTFLLSASLKKLAKETVFLNVRKGNRPARLLYKQAGFIAYGVTKDLLGEWIMLKKPPSV